MAITLESLPTELIKSILSRVEHRDVLSFRCVSRRTEATSFSHFGERFFRKKGFMITSHAIDRLIKIATHPALSRFVQHIWFNPDCYTSVHMVSVDSSSKRDDSDGDSDIPASAYYEDRFYPIHRSHRATPQQFSAWQDCMNDHFELLYRGKLARQLEIVFRHLSDLCTVGMRRSTDYNAYGWLELERKIGKDPRELGHIHAPAKSTVPRQATQLYITLIKALASNRKQVRRLYVDAIEFDRLDTSLLSQDDLVAACSSIEYLELNAIRPLTWKNSFDTASPQPGQEPGVALVRLFEAMPRLKDIGLQIFSGYNQKHHLPPVSRLPSSWMSTYPYTCLERLSLEAPFKHLTRCKLEKITTSCATLTGLLEESAPILQSLKLSKVRLLSTPDESLPWHTFFSFLENKCSSLAYLLLYSLLHETGVVAFIVDVDDEAERHWTDRAFLLQPIHNRRPHVSREYITALAEGRDAVHTKAKELRSFYRYSGPLTTAQPPGDHEWYTATSDENW